MAAGEERSEDRKLILLLAGVYDEFDPAVDRRRSGQKVVSIVETLNCRSVMKALSRSYIRTYTETIRQMAYIYAGM